MSSFEVTPADVSDVGGRLASIPGEVGDLFGGVVSCSGAGSATRIDGAFENLLGRWATTLPGLALAAAHVSVSLRGAAAGYGVTDASVGEECDGR
jgi:hypothetical protein